MPRSRREARRAPLHSARSRAHSSIRDAQVLALDCLATATTTVGVCSTARRRRNHEGSEMRRAAAGGVSPKSSTTTPKPPPWISRSAALRAGSAPWERTQIRRSNRTPAAAADAGSKASSASTSAQISSRAVACAKIASSRLVRPEEAGPTISVRHPRGNPPVASSPSRIPEGTISGAGRACHSKGPPRTDSNCFLSATAFIIFAFYSPVLYFYRNREADVKTGDESQITKIPNEPNFAANKKKIKQIIVIRRSQSGFGTGGFIGVLTVGGDLFGGCHQRLL